MSDLKISILMPAKNAEPYLSECLESIIRQTESHWELIVTDDHSTDRTRETALNYAAKDSRIKVLNNKGKGIIDALKTGFQNCSGNFITRMDADDLMNENKLFHMKTQLLQHGKGHVATSLVKYFSANGINDGYLKYETWLNALTRVGNNFDERYKECVIPSPSWMLYREDFIKLGRFDRLSYPEDYSLTFEMYKNDLNVIPCDKVLHYWRDHEERASRNDPNYADNRFLPLKINYFLDVDYAPEKELVVWGAGKKAKSIVKLLLKKQIPLSWVCNNPKKWGKEIYSIKIQSTKAFTWSSEQQVIACFSDWEEEKNKYGNMILSQVFAFC